MNNIILDFVFMIAVVFNAVNGGDNRAGFRVWVKQDNEYQHCIELNATATVHDIKVELSSLLSTDELFYKLTFAGQELKDEELLCNYGIGNEGAIEMQIVKENLENIRHYWAVQSLSTTFWIKIINKMREYQGKSVYVKVHTPWKKLVFVCKDKSNNYLAVDQDSLHRAFWYNPSGADKTFEYLCDSDQFIDWIWDARLS